MVRPTKRCASKKPCPRGTTTHRAPLGMIRRRGRNSGTTAAQGQLSLLICSRMVTSDLKQYTGISSQCTESRIVTSTLDVYWRGHARPCLSLPSSQFCFLIFRRAFLEGGGIKKNTKSIKTQLPAFVSCKRLFGTGLKCL